MFHLANNFFHLFNQFRIEDYFLTLTIESHN